MIITDQHSILTVCVPDAEPDADARAGATAPQWRAGSAAEALAMLRMARVDLLLTGLRLPDMNVWQLIRRVRALSSAPRWALVASADLSAAEEIQARSLGAIAVLERMPAGDALDELLARARRTLTPASAVTHSRHLVTERIQPSSRESEPCGSNS